MTGLSIILIIIGLSICFGAIYYRKLFSGFMGFCWSLTISLLLYGLAFLSGDLDTSAAVILIGLFVLVYTWLSVVYERICVALNSFLGFFSILFIVALLFSDSDERAVWVFLAVIFSIIPAGISYYFYDWAFILSTAFTGGLIASFGFYSLFTDLNSAVFKSMMVFGDSDFLLPIFAGAFVLGCLGTIVQLQKLKRLANTSPNTGSYHTMNSAAKSRIDLYYTIKAFGRRLLNSETIYELKGEKICIVLCLAGFVVFPLANNHVSFETTSLVLFINRAYYYLKPVAFAGLIYFSYTKSIKTGIIYSIPYIVVCLIKDIGWIAYSLFYGLLEIAEPLVILIASFYGFRKKMKTDIKYLASALLFVLYNYCLLRWFSRGYIYWSLTKEDFFPIICFIITLALFVYYKKKINIFDFSLFINQKAGRHVISNKTIAIIGVATLIISFLGFQLSEYINNAKILDRYTAEMPVKTEQENETGSDEPDWQIVEGQPFGSTTENNDSGTKDEARIIIVYERENTPDNFSLSVDCRLDDGSYPSWRGESLTSDDGTLLATLETVQTDSIIQYLTIYETNAKYSITVDYLDFFPDEINIGYPGVVTIIKDDSVLSYEEVDSYLIRSYTGYWFGGICEIDHGKVSEYNFDVE